MDMDAMNRPVPIVPEIAIIETWRVDRPLCKDRLEAFPFEEWTLVLREP